MKYDDQRHRRSDTNRTLHISLRNIQRRPSLRSQITSARWKSPAFPVAAKFMFCYKNAEFVVAASKIAQCVTDVAGVAARDGSLIFTKRCF